MYWYYKSRTDNIFFRERSRAPMPGYNLLSPRDIRNFRIRRERFGEREWEWRGYV